MVKKAEVTGVIAGLVDADYIKVASEEDFNAICDTVAGQIDTDDYTFDQVVEKTAEVMDEVYKIYEENGIIEKVADEKVETEVEAEKVAEEYTEGDILAAMGELMMAKEAGEVTAEEQESKMTELKEMLKKHKKAIGVGAGTAVAAGLGAKFGPKAVKTVKELAPKFSAAKTLAKEQGVPFLKILKNHKDFGGRFKK